jgi:hypothetical protein
VGPQGGFELEREESTRLREIAVDVIPQMANFAFLAEGQRGNILYREPQRGNTASPNGEISSTPESVLSCSRNA